MFAHDLHVALAWATASAMAAIALEAGVRTLRGRGPGRLAEAGLGVALVLIGMTAAAGLAMLVRGERPSEWLHFLYTILVFGLIPMADSFTARAAPRARGLARLAGAMVALVVIARLFSTG
jgi:hypothetical protein